MSAGASAMSSGVLSSLSGSSSAVVESFSQSVTLPSSSVLAPAYASSYIPASINSSLGVSSCSAGLSSFSSTPILSSSAVVTGLSASSSAPFLSSASLAAVPVVSSMMGASLLPVASSVGTFASSVGPIGSSVSTAAVSGLPSLESMSSLAPSAGPLSMSATYAPVISGAGSALSSKAGTAQACNWKYGFIPYDYARDTDDFEFRNLVIFGDSLSDTGSFGRGSVYMADGNPYVMYNSYLSLALAGKAVTPERFGGVNYAISGSVLRNDPLDPLSWVIPRDSLKN